MKKLISIWIFTTCLMALLFSTFSHGTYVQVSKSPPGTIIAFAGSSCPPFTQLANGDPVSRTSVYNHLFSAIGTAWGAGNGTTTFNLPDLRNRFLRGTGSSGDGNGGTAVSLAAYQEGETRVYTALATDSQGAHTHPYSYRIPNAGAGGSDGGGDNNRSLTTVNDTTSSSGSHTHNVASGQGGAETRPKSYGVTYCIFF